MAPTNQMSMVLENELNLAPSVFPVDAHTIHKLTILLQAARSMQPTNLLMAELRHFIELNQPPRYDVWA